MARQCGNADCNCHDPATDRNATAPTGVVVSICNVKGGLTPADRSCLLAMSWGVHDSNAVANANDKARIGRTVAVAVDGPGTAQADVIERIRARVDERRSTRPRAQIDRRSAAAGDRGDDQES